ncbi:MAG: VWA domain-containing protein [Planctomycetota bacterium]|nr:VWA domain-containing protein [Planctomycetota bacterium]
MILLAPTAALIGALLTIPPLVALYLLKMRRRPVRVSVVSLWPAAGRDAQANVPLAMIRPSWLLFLHALILVLLLLAVGRPALRSGGGFSGDRIYFLIDVSASMGARDEPGGVTRLERAIDRAARAGDDLLRGGGRRVGVIEVGATARIVENPTNSRAALRDALARLAPRDEPGDLGEAVSLIRALSAGEEEAPSPPTIALFSDGAFRQHGPETAVPAGLRFERVGPAGPAAPNAGIVALAARRDVLDPGTLRVFLDVLHTPTDGSTVPIAIALDGRVLERRVLDIPRATDPARVATSFSLPNIGGGVLTATISRDDALASDNLAALDILPAVRPAVWVVSPEGGAGRAPGGSLLLRETLAELRLRSVTDLTAEAYEARVANDGFERVDLIVFDRVTPRGMPRRPTLSFAGGPEIEGVARSDAPAGASGVVLWEREHPALRYVSLDGVTLSDAGVLEADESAEGVRVLARGARGALIVEAERAGVRHLLVSFDLSRSNWPLLPGFPVFLASGVDYLAMAGQASVGRSARTGESVTVRGPGDEVVYRGPVEVRAAARPGSETRAGPFTRAGVYVGPPRMEPRVVCVNVFDELESSIASPATLEIGGRTATTAAGAREVRELWAWFVAGALALLAVEWFVYARSVRS